MAKFDLVPIFPNIRCVLNEPIEFACVQFVKNTLAIFALSASKHRVAREKAAPRKVTFRRFIFILAHRALALSIFPLVVFSPRPPAFPRLRALSRGGVRPHTCIHPHTYVLLYSAYTRKSEDHRGKDLGGGGGNIFFCPREGNTSGFRFTREREGSFFFSLFNGWCVHTVYM